MHFHILAFLLFFQPFIASRQGRENAPPAGVIFQSTDGGQTWQDISAGLPDFLEVNCVFACSDKVFLGSESGLYRTALSDAPVWEKDILLPEKITRFFPGQGGPYACSFGSGFFQNISGTDIWIPAHQTLTDKTVRTVLETPDGAVFVGCDSGIFKCDDGNTWKKVFAEGMVMSLVAADDSVLIGAGIRGVLRSTDGGEHWNWVMTEYGAAFQTGFIEEGIAALTYDGESKRMHTSADNGKTWQTPDEGLSPVRFMNDIKQAGAYLFCSLDGGIYRSSDQGKTWKLVFPANGKKWINLAVSGQTVFAVMMQGC